MPNPEKFTPQRPIRVPDDLWEPYGEVVGERNRSADLKAYIEWKLRNPTADLSAIPTEQVVDLLVRIRIGPDGRRVEITELPGTGGAQAEKLKAEIRQLIADHFTPPPEPIKRTRKAAT